MIEQIPIGEEPLPNVTLLKEIIANSLTQGAVGVFIGVYLVGNNLMISSYGTQATAAASMVSTLQSVIVSPTAGFLAATGTRLGAAKKQTDHQRQKKDEEGIIKIALLSCVVLGVCNSAVFLTTKPIAPMWFDKEHSETVKRQLSFPVRDNYDCRFPNIKLTALTS